jgi:hypothetical protein
MVTEKRKVSIFIDNCAAHNLKLAFNTIQVQFLSPNTMSV